MNKVAIIVSLILAIVAGAGCTTSHMPEVIPDTEPLPQPQDKSPVVTVELGLPQPINRVLMLSSLGHGWGRTPPDKLWYLKWVMFDAKNFLPDTIQLDKAIVEIAGQVEEVPIDVSLEPQEYQVVTIEITSIKDVGSGEYLLNVSLESNGTVMCDREDIAKVYWE